MADVVNLFHGTRNVKNVLSFMLMRGVTDFGDLSAFNLYESGYSFFVVMSIPKFMSEVTKNSSEYKNIIQNYAHILEFENRGLNGIENISVDTGELTNGINSVKIINKVNKPSDTTFTATYQEKLGSTITKAHELFLTGIKDPRTQVKTYLGVLANGIAEAGYENEVFSFMYIVCDNTLRNLERAIYITAAQPQNAPLDIYNSERGTYEFKEISVEFSGFPITSKSTNILADNMRKYIFSHTNWMESSKEYSVAGKNGNPSKANTTNATSYFFNAKETNTGETNSLLK